MIKKTVVIGSKFSPLGVLPFQRDLVKLDKPDKMFSGKDYGNFLPQLWGYLQDLVLNYMDHDDLLTNSFHETTWSIIARGVDGLLVYNGVSPVVEVNGSLYRAKCIRCDHVQELCYADYEEMDDVPTCENCGKKRMRPDIVLAGEKLHCKRLATDFVRDSKHVVFLGVDYNDHNIEEWIEFAENPLIVDTVIPEKYQHLPHLVMDAEQWVDEGLPYELNDRHIDVLND